MAVFSGGLVLFQQGEVGKVNASNALLSESLSLMYQPGRVGRELSGDYGNPSAKGMMYMNPESNDAVLVAYNLPASPAREIYQVWLNNPEVEQRVSGGTFKVDDRARARHRPPPAAWASTSTATSRGSQAAGSPKPTGHASSTAPSPPSATTRGSPVPPSPPWPAKRPRRPLRVQSSRPHGEKMALTPEQVEHVAALARLGISQAERRASPSSCPASSTTSRPAGPGHGGDSAHGAGARPAQRDAPGRRPPSLPQGEVLANAPRAQDGFFRVQAVLEE